MMDFISVSLFNNDITLYVTAVILSITSLWGLIELTRNKTYRWTLWGIIPAILVAVWLLVISSTSLKGMPTTKLMDEEWFLITYVVVKDQGIYLWILEDGKKEPTNIKLPYSKQLEEKVREAAARAARAGRPVRGKFPAKGMFGNDRSDDPQMWQFSVDVAGSALRVDKRTLAVVNRVAGAVENELIADHRSEVLAEADRAAVVESGLHDLPVVGTDLLNALLVGSGLCLSSHVSSPCRWLITCLF